MNTIRLRCYFYTTIIGTLLWPLSLWVFGYPDLLQFIITHRRVGGFLMLSVASAILGAVWSADAFFEWIRISRMHGQVQLLLTRLAIGLLADAIFSISYFRVVRTVTGNGNYPYLDGFLGPGLNVAGSVLLAIVIVNILVLAPTLKGRTLYKK